MLAKKEICFGMVGTGRATELHMNALSRYHGVPVRYKHIVGHSMEKAKAAQERYGFEQASVELEELLKDEEIDVVDICTPPYAHEEMIVKSLQAGKHVICEKPLCGYFGCEADQKPIGKYVSKVKMYEEVMKVTQRLRKVIADSGKKFMYAENFVYAPAIKKAAEIISKKGSSILFAKGEESLKGSSSPVAGEWSKTGGGTFMRTGAHPLSAILWLKQVEARTQQKNIQVESVMADMGQITPSLTEYQHRHIAAYPQDVEDVGTVILTFSDKTKAVIMATDTLLGGSKNYVDLYCNDAVINCNLTMSNLMSTYFLDEERLDDVYISEMLPSKLGWNNPFLEDEIIRGYTEEMRDFIEAVYFEKEAQSGFDLACDTIRIIYAAYKSAELGKSIRL